MKNIKLLPILIFALQFAYGQSTDYKKELIDLGKIYYHAFGSSKDLPEDVINQLAAINSPELAKARDFVSELIKDKPDITTQKHLTKPDSVTLKNLYIMRRIRWNLFEEKPKDNNFIIDSLSNEETNYHELISSYYDIIFVFVSNKYRPFNMRKVNFDLSDYNLENDTEKGIFFLQSMETFGSLIWGYIHIANPPNFKQALSFINNFPTYNGLPYYKFLALQFSDFKVTTDITKPKESFRGFYLDKYMNTIFYHSLCLSQNKKDQKKVSDVLFGSILGDESYWQYSKNPEVFESIFQKQSRD